jgi:hypothetical protein
VTTFYFARLAFLAALVILAAALLAFAFRERR